MSPDLRQAINGAATILATVLSRPKKVIQNYILVPFQDPEIGPMTVTENPDKFQQMLRDLYVQGGGDCPETSLGAIKIALENCLQNSFIFVFTDASAKDHYLIDQVLALIQEKQSQVVFVLTGTCDGYKDIGYKVYQRIADASSGQVFNLHKNQVELLLDFVRISLQATKVYLESVANIQVGTHNIDFPVDMQLTEITISVSGLRPSFKLFSPAGMEMKEVNGLKVLMRLENNLIIMIKNPQVGIWKLSVTCENTFNIKITGLSLFNFYYGFGVDSKIHDIKQTFRGPIKSFKNYLLIVTNDLMLPGRVTEVLFVDYKNEIIQRMSVTTFGKTTYIIPLLSLPKEDFFIKILGINLKKEKFLRISSTVTRVMKGPAPKISMHTHKYLSQISGNVTFTCTIKSVLPYFVTWYKDRNILNIPKKYSESSLVEFKLVKLKMSDAGRYSCKAHSSVGQTQDYLQLSVTELAPQLLPSKVVHVGLGHDATLTCASQRPGKYRREWLRETPGFLNYQKITSAHSLTADGSLYLRGVRHNSIGTYVCKVYNSGGESEVKMYLKVEEKPVVKAMSEKMTFVQGSKVLLKCTSQQHVSFTWSKNGFEVKNNERFKSSEGFLKITRSVQEDEGVWQCKGTNSGGSSIARITLQFIEKPRVRVSTEKVVVLCGSSATLVCFVTGTPKPTISWFKSGAEINNFVSMEQNKLVLMGVKQKDEGKYECRAHNLAGSSYKHITLIVASTPEITTNSGHQKVKIHKDVVLRCHTAGQPQLRMKWFREDGKVMDLYRFIRNPDGSLHINGVQKEDEGVYICEASNQYGSDRKKNYVEVTAIVKPRFESEYITVEADEGTNVVLGCRTMQALPPASIQWYRNNQTLHSNGGDLSLQNVRKHDEGKYVCEATNQVGHAKLETTLKLRIPPRILDNQTKFKVMVGQTATLICKLPNLQGLKVHWFKKNVVLTDGPHVRITAEHSLVIMKTIKKDTSEYVCVVSNMYGKDSKVVHLEVMGNYEDSGRITVINALYGQPIELKCSIARYYNSFVLWKYNNQTLPFDAIKKCYMQGHYCLNPYSGSLMIAVLRLSDHGMYSCYSKSSSHFQGNTIQLNVHVSPKIASFGVKKTSKGGSIITINCFAVGSPKPQMTWFYDDEPLMSKQQPSNLQNSSSSSIIVDRVSFKNPRLYTCMAKNIAGVDIRKYKVIPQRPPRFNDYIGVNEDRTQVSLKITSSVGKHFTLWCNVTALPAPTIKWFKDGHLLHTFQKNKIEDYVQNDFDLTHLNNNLLKSKKIQTFKNNVPMKKVNFHPVDNFHNSHYIQNPPTTSKALHIQGYWLSPNQMNILNVKSSDFGAYSCIASNILGKATKTVVIRVNVIPYFTNGKKKSEVKKMKGKFIMMDCPASGFPKPTIRWFIGGNEIFRNNLNYKILLNGASLKVWRSSESGNYKCVAENIAGSVCRHFHLKNIHGPKINTSNVVTKISLREGSLLKMSCQASGYPLPTLSWTKSGLELHSKEFHKYDFQKNRSVLIIRRVESQDRGEYVCKAVNEVGSVSKHYIVTVLVAIRLDRRKYQEKFEVRKGMQIHLHCFILQGRTKETKVVWEKNMKVVDTVHNHRLRLEGFYGETFKIRDSEMNDEASYSCHVSNQFSSDSLTFKVFVIDRPHIKNSRNKKRVFVKEGETLRLKCEVSGHPVAKISWFKERNSLEQVFGRKFQMQNHRSDILVTKMKQTDQGEYICMASNKVGSSSKHFIVTVHTRIRIDKRNGHSEQKIRRGHLISLSCFIIEGITKDTTINWLKNGKKVNDLGRKNIRLGGEHKNNLKILSADLRDQGTYTCKADNHYSQDTLDFHIFVVDAPKIKGGNVKAYISVKEKSVLRMECEAFGLPVPSIHWSKQGIALEKILSRGVQMQMKGRVLMLENASKKTHEGEYVCTASNEVASVRKTYIVTVLEPVVIDTRNYKRTVTVIQGNPFSLRCLVIKGQNKNTRITWLMDGQAIKSMNNLKFFDDHRGFLKVQSAIPEHKAIYKCEVTNGFSKSSLSYNIQVLVPTRINARESSKERLTTVLGHKLEIFCDAHGIPTPKIRWFLNSKEINFMSDRSWSVSRDIKHLILNSPQRNHMGTYMCQASNEAGSDTRKFHLQLLSPPRISNSHEIYKVIAIKSSTVHLPCQANGFPQPKMTWFDSKHQHIHSNTLKNIKQDELVIHDVKLQDSGVFYCKAVNDAGKATKEFILTVHEQPSIDDSNVVKNPRVTLGKLVILECPAKGHPVPKINWKFNGHPLFNSEDLILQEDSRVLRIKSVSMRDEGMYTCIVQNSAGVVRLTFKLEVEVPAKIEDAGRVSEITSSQGQRVELVCNASGKPAPTFIWLKDGMPTMDMGGLYKEQENGKKLVIEKIKKSDEGKFTCIARNNAGLIKKHFHLNIYVKVTIEDDGKPSDMVMSEGETVEMTCRSRTFPPPLITWFKNNIKVNPLSLTSKYQMSADYNTLTITHSSTFDSGTYKCVASSHSGSAERIFTVVIHAGNSFSASTRESYHYGNMQMRMGCDTAGCQYKCQQHSFIIQCICPQGYVLNNDHKTCKDVDECQTQNRCRATERCFNTKGNYRCIDVSCPKPYFKDAATGLCLHKCNTPNGMCKEGKFLYRDILHFVFVTVQQDAILHKVLFQISAYDDKRRFLPNATFTLQNMHEVPFRIKKGTNYKAQVYAIRKLERNSLHSLMIKAVSTDLDDPHVILKTTFNVHVAVSEFKF